jgi:hypothetical protein
MSKKILITEEEKNQIKSLYNLDEQAGDIFKGLGDTIVNMIKTGKYGDESKDSTDNIDSDDSDNLPSKITSDDDFYKGVLKCIGAEPTKSNMLFMYAWRQSEGGKAKNNPFNTTQKMPGATKVINSSVGIKNYSSPEEGIEATCKTLKNGRDKYGYDKIIDGFKNDVGLLKLSDAVINSKWGTKDLLRKVTQGYIAGNSPKPHPINKTSIA